MGLDFGVLLFENDEEIKISGLFKNAVFKTDSGGREIIISLPGSFLNSEYLLSTLDFKNHILGSKDGITFPISVYSKENEIPRNFILKRFLTNVKAGKIKITDFDEEPLENLRLVMDLSNSFK
jgi:hypothetical protein